LPTIAKYSAKLLVFKDFRAFPQELRTIGRSGGRSIEIIGASWSERVGQIRMADFRVPLRLNARWGTGLGARNGRWRQWEVIPIRTRAEKNRSSSGNGGRGGAECADVGRETWKPRDAVAGPPR
jgi:hypothetical protein